jgi:hypothetical protein
VAHQQGREAREPREPFLAGEEDDLD